MLLVVVATAEVLEHLRVLLREQPRRDHAQRYVVFALLVRKPHLKQLAFIYQPTDEPGVTA